MDKVKNSSLNTGVFSFLNGLSSEDLHEFLAMKQPADLDDEWSYKFENALNIKDKFSELQTHYECIKTHEKLLDKIISAELNDDTKFDDINIDAIILAFIVKFKKYAKNKDDLSVEQICEFSSFLANSNDKFYKFLAFKICKNILMHSLQTWSNSSSNPFLATMFYDFMQDDFNDEFKSKFNIGGAEFSYFDEYNKKNIDYDEALPTDLILFNHFIKDTQLQEQYDLTKEFNLFSLNEFLTSNFSNSDFSTLSIAVKKDEVVNVVKQEEKGKFSKFIKKMQNIIHKG